MIASNLANVGTINVTFHSVDKLQIYEITQPSSYLPQTHWGILSKVREQKANIEDKFGELQKEIGKLINTLMTFIEPLNLAILKTPNISVKWVSKLLYLLIKFDLCFCHLLTKRTFIYVPTKAVLSGQCKTIGSTFITSYSLCKVLK